MEQSLKRYNCIIIDDDLSTVRLMSEYIAMAPKLVLVKSYTDPRIAIREFDLLGEVDFLFLDINMVVSGLDIGMLLRDRVRFIIIISGHPEYALAAFKVEADNFLLKPVRFEKFVTTVNKVISAGTLNHQNY